MGYRGAGCGISGVSCVVRVDSDKIPYHAHLGRHAADMHPHYIHIHIHIKTHIHTAPINRSIGQSPRPSVSPSVSQSRQIEPYRVREGGGVACLHHAARRSFKSPPGDLARYRCPHCCVAVLMR